MDHFQKDPDQLGRMWWIQINNSITFFNQNIKIGCVIIFY